MIKFFRNKNNDLKFTPGFAEGTLEDRLRNSAERFISSNSIEVVEDNVKQKLPPIKWLYPGYGEFTYHLIVPREDERLATEVINEAKFVNEFLLNRRDIIGRFGYFVARIEGNYVKMADNGNRIFDAVKESDVADYETLALIKQAKRLFPKFSPETLSVELKHIEIFGEVFNKLKSRFSAEGDSLLPEKAELISLDIPTYTSTSIQIENSLESYNIFKLSQTLERLSKDTKTMSFEQAKAVVSLSLRNSEKVKDSLYGSSNSSRYHRPIENLEKITDHLSEIDNLLYQLLSK